MSGSAFPNDQNPIAVSLFSGAGGLCLGFKEAGYRIVYASDIEPAAVATYKKNFPSTPIDCEDVRELETARIRSFIPKNRDVDVLIGGPPCQGFSSAGAKWWDDPRNSLLKSYVQKLSDLRPRWFLMENVEGLLTANGGEYLYEFLKRAVHLGYSVRVDKLTLSQFGLPQKRKRVFVVGNRAGIHFQPPTPTHVEDDDLSISERVLTITDGIGDLVSDSECAAPMNDFQRRLRNSAGTTTLHAAPKLPKIQLQRIRHLKPGQNMRHLPPELQHESFRRRAFRRVMDGTPTEKRGGAPAGLQRLLPDQPAKTITGAATREFIHPKENRPLTLRECARLQSFPDWFRFEGTTSEIATQIGNAVPPMIGELLANAILKQESQTGRSKADSAGKLLGFYLTKSTGMSPALERTKMLLTRLMQTNP